MEPVSKTDENAKEEEVVCRVCKKDENDDQVVLCDLCGDGYHSYCFKGCTHCGEKSRDAKFGKVPTIPEGDWFCRFCAGRAPQLAADATPLSRVWGWGCNKAGQLGLGKSESNEPEPKLVEDLQGVRVVQMAAGGWNSAALAAEGNVYTCGDCENGKTGHPDVVHEFLPRFRHVDALAPEAQTGNCGAIKKVALGRDFACFVSSGGHLFTVGNGEVGNLGHQDNKTVRVPKKVSALRERFSELPVGSTVACGWTHTLAAVSETGEVLAWGSARCGELGTGDSRNQWVPKLINAKKAHTLAYSGDTQNPCTLPPVSQLACGRSHSLALADGCVWSWGAGHCGQLGHGDGQEGKEKEKEKERPATPQQVQPKSAVSSFFKKMNLNTSRPKLVTALQGKRVVAIAAGADFSAALTSEGKVWTWGGNGQGELGLGHTKDEFTPQEVSIEGRVTSIACGDNHCLALTDDGKVYAWGKGSEGQLGQGEGKTASSPVPLQIPNLPKIQQIFAGGDHSFAIEERPASLEHKAKKGRGKAAQKESKAESGIAQKRGRAKKAAGSPKQKKPAKKAKK